MSEPLLISEEYVLVIDTDQYAGHFLEDLAAYCTGFVGECEKGRACSDLFYMEMGIDDDGWPKGKLADEKNPFHGFVGDRQDEVGYWSPCSLWLSRTHGTDGNGNYAVLTEENYDIYKYPAPLSVGIFFDVRPTDFQIELIRDRAAKFFESVYPKMDKDDSKPSQVKLEGLRLICHKKYAEEIAF